MNNTRQRVLFVASVAILAVAAGIATRQMLQADRENGVTELQQLALPDPRGRVQRLSQWQGKVLVVNFWATWCEPCRQEVPALVRIQQKNAANGVQIVGIGIDSAAKIRQFALEYRINYPLAVAGPEIVDITRKLGNKAGGLPYTVLLDRNGRFAASHLGGLTEEGLDELLRPLVAS